MFSLVLASLLLLAYKYKWEKYKNYIKSRLYIFISYFPLKNVILERSGFSKGLREFGKGRSWIRNMIGTSTIVGVIFLYWTLTLLSFEGSV
jgi:hypothetical protein